MTRIVHSVADSKESEVAYPTSSVACENIPAGRSSGMQPCLRSLWSSLARSCSLSNVDFRGWISKCRFHNVEPKVRTQNFWSPQSLRLKQRGTQPTRRHRKAVIALLLHDRWPVGYSGNAKLVFVSIRLMVAHRHMLATHGWTNLRPVINFWLSLNIYSSYELISERTERQNWLVV